MDRVRAGGSLAGPTTRRRFLAGVAALGGGAVFSGSFARKATPTLEEETVSRPRTLVTGLAFGESPRWHDDRLWFIDMGTNEILAADLAGKSEVVANIPAGLTAIDFQPDGRLLIVSMGDRSLLRRETDGSLATYADLSGLSDRPWNDLIVDGRGNAYVGNLGFDFPAGEFRPGLVALVARDGAVRQVADGVAFPNGMAITPDNATLIVAESYGNKLTAFDIAADGGLSHRRVWADLGDGVPDGVCLDAEGAVWYADVPNKRCVRVAEGGRVLQTIGLDRGCFACALGGAERRTLFLMAAEMPDLTGTAEAAEPTGQVLAVEVPAPGVGWP